MVLNYKDSIKAEMSLSAMLGKNVDLSEVRAKFMSGDTEGALSSLKAKGLKPSEMNMFQKQALQQQQQMIDSLDVTYQQRIEEARAAGNVAEADRLTNEYVKARGVMLAEQGKLSTDILNSYANASGDGFEIFGLGGGAKSAMNSGADKAIAKTFEGTANEDMAKLAGDSIKDASGLSDAQDYTLRVALSTGDIDPSLLFGFMEQFGSDQATMQATMNIVTTMGGAFAADTMQIANMFVDAEGNPLPDLQKEFVSNISAKTPADAQKYLDVFATAKNVGEVVDLKTVMSYVLKNPQAQKKIVEGQKLIDNINLIRTITI
jgi:hypothetical protein